MRDLLSVPMQRVLKYHLLLKVCFNSDVPIHYSVHCSSVVLVREQQILSVVCLCQLIVPLELVGNIL